MSVKDRADTGNTNLLTADAADAADADNNLLTRGFTDVRMNVQN